MACDNRPESSQSGNSDVEAATDVSHDDQETTQDFKQVKGCSRWWISFLASGVASSLGFLMAMLLYSAAVPINQLGSPVLCSWLYFWGAVFFVMDSFVDFIGQGLAGVTDSRKCVLSDEPEAPQPSSSVASCFHGVDWEFWSIVFFLVPSIAYLLESLLDPNVVGHELVGALNASVIDTVSFATACDWTAALLFVLDACLRLVAHWHFHAFTPSEEKDQLMYRACGMTIDVVGWADMVFLLGALVDVYGKLWKSLLVSTLSSGLWTVDALLYIIGSWPLMKTMLHDK